MKGTRNESRAGRRTCQRPWDSQRGTEDPEKQSHPGCCDILYYTRLHGITHLIPPAWPLQCGVAPSLPEVPRGRARDGLLLPDGLQPLRPGGHHPLSFFFGRHFRTKTDLRGKDFKSAEVQRAVLQCKEGSAVRSRPLLSHPGNARSWPPGSSENLPPPASRECGRCPAASGPGRSWGAERAGRLRHSSLISAAESHTKFYGFDCLGKLWQLVKVKVAQSCQTLRPHGLYRLEYWRG